MHLFIDRGSLFALLQIQLGNYEYNYGQMWYPWWTDNNIIIPVAFTATLMCIIAIVAAILVVVWKLPWIREHGSTRRRKRASVTSLGSSKNDETASVDSLGLIPVTNYSYFADDQHRGSLPKKWIWVPIHDAARIHTDTHPTWLSHFPGSSNTKPYMPDRDHVTSQLQASHQPNFHMAKRAKLGYF
jgi:hypothetical protein